ncbi:MAG TPA: MmcQ/YjbR family DNA-binding protein [Spirochaetes bacterium]|nr:MmcQ/YjbR family DNA-binding protein [Spirochaetota bacterium]
MPCLEEIRSYCASKPGAFEDFPFGPDVLVFKTGKNKIFGLIRLGTRPVLINLKCEPFLALELREKYDAVKPGYHMNKTHWNTVTVDGSIPDEEIIAMIDLSFDLVNGKTAKKR